MMVMLMNELKESELIVAEIKKTERLYDDMKKYIINAPAAATSRWWTPSGRPRSSSTGAVS